jgi:Transposase DDE domain
VAENRVISTVDPQARHVHKTVHHRQDGYKAHVAIEPDTGLFTAGELTEASGEDNHEAVVGLDLLDNDDQPGPFGVLGDSAYGTGEARAALAEAGHTAIINPGYSPGMIKSSDRFGVGK